MKIKFLFFIAFIVLIALYFFKINNHNETSGFELKYIDKEIIRKLKTNTLVNFCGISNSACNQFQPTLKMLFNELGGQDIKIFNIDIFENPELLNNFPIPLIPIQFFFTKDGKSYNPSNNIGIKFEKGVMNNEEFYYHIGILSKEEIIKIFNEMKNL